MTTVGEMVQWILMNRWVIILTSCGAKAQQTPSPYSSSLHGFSEMIENWIRLSHGHSTPSLKISCKSVQPFSRNLANKETKKEKRYKQRNRTKTIPRPLIYRGRSNDCLSQENIRHTSVAYNSTSNFKIVRVLLLVAGASGQSRDMCPSFPHLKQPPENGKHEHANNYFTTYYHKWNSVHMQSFQATSCHVVSSVACL